MRVPSHVHGKGLARHVAELDALTPDRTVADIVDSTRTTIHAALYAARSEVLLNVWCSTALPDRQ